MTRLKLAGDWAPADRQVHALSFGARLVLNLEGPIVEGGGLPASRVKKAGRSLLHESMPSTSLPGIATLANNHLFDYGERGYKETAKLLERNCWLYVGAGESKREAREPIDFDWNGRTVGVVARCEVQFGIAQHSKSGVAGFDTTVFEQIRALKSRCDIVIASIHAAAEMAPWPSPQRQDTWRALVDAGADIVHGHHAHVPQGWEEYNGGWIFYGLGNFCVDPDEWSWHPNGLWSLAPEISIIDGQLAVTPKTVVIEETPANILLRDATMAEYKQQKKYLSDCNYPLHDRLLLEGLWQEASMRMYDSYYADWLGFDVPPHKALSRESRKYLDRFRYNLFKRNDSIQGADSTRRQHLLRYHLFACESHTDAIATALGVLGGELNDLRTKRVAQLLNKWMLLS